MPVTRVRRTDDAFSVRKRIVLRPQRMLTRAEEDLIRQGGRGVTAEIILRKEKAFRAPVD